MRYLYHLSNMFLDVTQYVMHIIVVIVIRRVLHVRDLVGVVICAASVAMACRWELHIHYWRLV